MMKKLTTLAAAAGVLLIQGCSTVETYQEGKRIPSEQIALIKDGMPKAEVLQLLGNPYDTEFVELTEQDVERHIRVKELMTYHFAAGETRTQPPILGGAARKTGALQQLEVSLENKSVVSHKYTEGRQ